MSAPIRHPRRQIDGKVLIGVSEYVRLPEFRVGRIRAKIDTGARSSALHVDRITEVEGDRVRFDVVLHPHGHLRTVHCEAPISRRAEVRSSSGAAEERYFVVTKMLLGSVEREIEISLTSRSDMRYRMLLGRTALKGAFVVDPGRRYYETRMERREMRESQTTKKKKKGRKGIR